MAATVYDDFQDDLSRALNNWQRNFVLPYGSAYSTAYKSYNDTLDTQKKADEAERQRLLGLAMFALSFAGGSLLTSVFGSAALKTLASDAAVDIICKREWQKAFQAASFVAENKTAQFMLGTLWDKAESALGDTLKGKLTENQSNFPSMGKFAQQPLNLQNGLDMWVRDMFDIVSSAGTAVNRMFDGQQKAALLNGLRGAHFIVAAPRKRIDETTIENEIELSMFMKFLIDSDYLAKGAYIEKGRGGWSKQIHSHTPINVHPTSKEYPTYKQGAWGDFQEVGYQDVGDIIVERINKLSRSTALFPLGFFGVRETWGGLSEEYESNSKFIVERAYAVLGILGHRNRNLMALTNK